MRETACRERWPWRVSLAVIVLWYPTLTWCWGSRHGRRPSSAWRSTRWRTLAGGPVRCRSSGDRRRRIRRQRQDGFVFRNFLRSVAGSAGSASGFRAHRRHLVVLSDRGGISAWLQIRSIGLVWTEEPASPRRWLATGLLISVVLGAAHPYLRPSIYQEPINWLCSGHGVCVPGDARESPRRAVSIEEHFAGWPCAPVSPC